MELCSVRCRHRKVKCNFHLMPLLWFLLAHFHVGYPSFQSMIPNGNRVPSPYNQTVIWPGVGHYRMEGAGKRNPFGTDFQSEGFKWTLRLCQMDSDLDGRTNGEELGDRYCRWSPGNDHLLQPPIGHPGFDEAAILANGEASTITKPTSNEWCQPRSGEKVLYTNLLLPHILVPEEQTTYYCVGYKLPSKARYHAIRFDPIIDKSNLIHHMLLYGCQQPILTGRPIPCSSMPGYCQNLLNGWGVGGGSNCFPPEAGLPFGKDDFIYVAIQVHYNNPQHLKGYRDSSGMRIAYTENLREHDAAIMILGTDTMEIAIPPGNSHYVLENECPIQCTIRSMRNHSVTVFSAIPHMHQLGRQLWTEHYRCGSRLPDIVRTMTFDFSMQETIPINKIQIQAGDRLVTKCVYDSTSKTNYVTGGESSNNEMCLNFLTYYPALISKLKPFCRRSYLHPDVAPIANCFDNRIGMPSVNVECESELTQYPSCIDSTRLSLQLCKDFIPYDNVFLRPGMVPQDLEADVRPVMEALRLVNLSDSCSRAISHFYCAITFPYCKSDKAEIRTIPLCKDQCRIVHHLCYDELIDAGLTSIQADLVLMSDKCPMEENASVNGTDFTASQTPENMWTDIPTEFPSIAQSSPIVTELPARHECIRIGGQGGFSVIDVDEIGGGEVVIAEFFIYTIVIAVVSVTLARVAKQFQVGKTRKDFRDGFDVLNDA